jgi:senataxin
VSLKLHLHPHRKLISGDSKFDDEVVEKLAEIINHIDFERIGDGMKTAQDKLLHEIERSKWTAAHLGDADVAALSALYEGLCCDTFLTSKDERLQQFFDIFDKIQVNKVLVLRDIVPATVRFLFEADSIRYKFARKGWKSSSTNRNIDEKIFEWAIRDPLVDAIRSVTRPGAAIEDVKRFWEAFLLIVDHLDEKLVTHSLRDVHYSPNIYQLAVMHLAYDSDEVLKLAIHAIELLIQKAHKVFWDTFGSVSPSAIADQVFASPAFMSLVSRSRVDSLTHDIQLSPAVAWITPFLRSLQPAQQLVACQSILTCLLERFQHTKFPQEDRDECLRAGLHTLLSVFTTFTPSTYAMHPATSFITISDLLGLVVKYKDKIMYNTDPNRSRAEQDNITALGSDVVQQAILLESKAWRAEYQAAVSADSITHGNDKNSRLLWDMILDSFKNTDLKLAKNILVGIIKIHGLGKIVVGMRDVRKKLIPLTQDEIRFNGKFDVLVKEIARIYERLSEFAPEDLQKLVQDQKASLSLFAGLLAADPSIHEAAVETIKTLSGELSRRDAISYMLQGSFESTLTSMFRAVDAASRLDTFSPFPYIIRISRDTLQILCDAQDGILRSKSTTPGERQSLKSWWMSQWRATGTAFRMTEQWSSGPHKKEFLEDFVRDTIDHAETLFDQYNLVATALGASDDTIDSKKLSSSFKSSHMVRRDLLEQPRQAMEYVILWLRLRNAYLITNTTSLVSKILRRLGEYDMEVDDNVSTEIYKLYDGTTKSNLTSQQRAELQRALGEHKGVTVVDDPLDGPVRLLKHNTVGGIIEVDKWAANAQRARSSPAATAVESSRAKTLDEMRLRQQIGSVQKSKLKALPRTENFVEARKREKREADAKRAAEAAKARALRGELTVVEGEGSGLRGLGVLGKDHAPAKAEMMVSSDSDDSEDDEPAENTLLTKRPKSTKQSVHYGGLVQPQGPVKKTKIIRSAKDMRARLVPNMDNLHLTILNWEMFHDSDDPPGGIDCAAVPNTFMVTDEYKRTFEPLLISEAWRSFKTSKEENMNKSFAMKVINRASVDRFFEVSTTVPIAESRDISIMEGDIVLLSKGSDPSRDTKELHCLARVYRQQRKKDVQEISYRVSGKLSPQTSLLQLLVPNGRVYGVKITSMTTIEREYAALSGLLYFDLCPEILEAKPSPILRHSDMDVDRIKAQYQLNSGQAKAILSAKKNDAFTLIQGYVPVCEVFQPPLICS